jgi:hypothetical protein
MPYLGEANKTPEQTGIHGEKEEIATIGRKGSADSGCGGPNDVGRGDSCGRDIRGESDLGFALVLLAYSFPDPIYCMADSIPGVLRR